MSKNTRKKGSHMTNSITIEGIARVLSVRVNFFGVLEILRPLKEIFSRFEENPLLFTGQ